MISPFKNKILTPTLFANSNEINKYMPAAVPMTVQEKVNEKRKN
jgi:hypothetical protein